MLRVQLSAQLTVSYDISANPQQLAFASGLQGLIDTATWTKCVSDYITVPLSTADFQVPLAGIAEADLIYILVIPTVQPILPNTQIVVEPLQVKLVPLGGDPLTTPFSIIPFGVPALIPFKVQEIHLANTDSVTDIVVQIGIVGN